MQAAAHIALDDLQILTGVMEARTININFLFFIFHLSISISQDVKESEPPLTLLRY